MSSLRRFARPATMPGDAISCTTGWSWGGARAPPVGPRSSRGGHGLLFGWANRRWTHPLRMAVTPRTQRIAASNNSEFIFSKAPEPARGRSKRETASATVPAGLRKGEVVLALPVTNVRARHAQHTGLGYVFMRTEGAPPSTWLLVVGQFPSSVARAGCRRLALRLLRMSDAHLGTGTGGPLASSVQALHNTGDLTCPAGGQKCALHFLGLGTRVWAAAGRTGQGLAAAADAADHSRKAPTSPRHDDARRGLAGYDHDTSGRRHAAAMSGCSAAVASAVASMASSVSLLAAMITEEAAAAYLARRKRSRFPTWCESVSPHCSYRVPSSLRSRWSPHCSYLRVSGVCGRRTVPTFVSPCTIMVSPLPGRRVLLCASPGIRSWSLCCRSVLNRRSPATNRFRAIPRSVSATVPDRPGSFPLC